MTLTIPDWCRIGATVEYQYRPGEWVEETVHSYGTDGFFHQAYGCPMYYSAYSDFGRTIRLKGQPSPAPEAPKNREEYGKWSKLFRENPTAYHELRIMQIAIWYLQTQIRADSREYAVHDIEVRIRLRIYALSGRYGIGDIAADELARYFFRPVPPFDGEEPGILKDAQRLAKETLKEYGEGEV